jgi:tRNA A37 threonylcarbamoyltransferase TsaD
MKDHLHFKVIGETRDDAVGEAYDKVARTIAETINAINGNVKGVSK